MLSKEEYYRGLQEELASFPDEKAMERFFYFISYGKVQEAVDVLCDYYKVKRTKVNMLKDMIDEYDKLNKEFKLKYSMDFRDYEGVRLEYFKYRRTDEQLKKMEKLIEKVPRNCPIDGRLRNLNTSIYLLKRRYYGYYDDWGGIFLRSVNVHDIAHEFAHHLQWCLKREFHEESAHAWATLFMKYKEWMVK